MERRKIKGVIVPSRKKERPFSFKLTVSKGDLEAILGKDEAKNVTVDDLEVLLVNRLKANAVESNKGFFMPIIPGMQVPSVPGIPIVPNSGTVTTSPDPQTTNEDSKQTENSEKEPKKKWPLILGAIGITAVLGLAALLPDSCDSNRETDPIADLNQPPIEQTAPPEIGPVESEEFTFVKAPEPPVDPGTESIDADQGTESVDKEKITTETITVIANYGPHINGPQDNTLGVVGELGQEGEFNNMIEGQGIEGEHYSGDAHYEKEKLASSGLDEFRESKQKIQEAIEVLNNPDSSSSERLMAVQTISTETDRMKAQYDERESLIDSAVQDFAAATDLHEDELSGAEKAVTETMRETFKYEQATLADNAEGLKELLSKLENGDDIQIEAVTEDAETGLFTITGTVTTREIEEVVEQQKLSEIKQAWQTVKDSVNEEKTVENANTDIEK